MAGVHQVECVLVVDVDAAGEDVRVRVRGGEVCERGAARRGSARTRLVLRFFVARRVDEQQQLQVDVALGGKHVVVRVLLVIIRRVDGADGGRVAHLRQGA